MNTNKFLLASLVAMLTTSVAFAGIVTTASYQRRVEITLSQIAVTSLGEGSFSGVPVLVRLSESAISDFHYSDFLSNGADLVFADADDNEIPHEIDTWNPSGESLVWIRPATLSASMGPIFMYYGASSATPSSSTGVWSEYVGVWHLNDTVNTSTYGTFPNSTAVSGIDGEMASHSTANEAGRIGKSFRVNDGGFKTGNYNYGGVFVNDSGTGSPLDLGDTFAISGWFKHADQQLYYDHFFYKRQAADNAATKPPTGAFAIEIAVGSGKTAQVGPRGSSSGNTKVSLSSNMIDVWAYMTFVYSGNKCYVYQNGVLAGTSSINAVVDNDAPLAFGNNCLATGENIGDAAWCGWIDEVRLMDGVPTAEWLAAEYEAMTTEGYLEFGASVLQDADAPLYASASVSRNASNTGFAVTAELTSGKGVMNAIFTDVVSGNAITVPFNNGSSVTMPGTYTAEVLVPALPANRLYRCAIQVVTPSGTVTQRSLSDVFSGELSVEQVSDAEELTLAPGHFAVISPVTLPAPFTAAYSVGGTAVAGETYVALPGTTDFAASSSTADISVLPVFSVAVDEDVTVSVDISAGVTYLLGATTTAELTIVNSELDPYARYVSPTGNDTTGSGLRDNPYATIGKALSTLDGEGGTIWLFDGEYGVSAAINVTIPVTIRSISEDPATVTVKRASGNFSIFTLNCADAKLLDITITGGSVSDKINGGCVNIGTVGGVVEHCIIRDSNVSSKYGSAGGGIYMSAGYVTRCVIFGNVANYNGGGGGVYIAGGQVESSLIYSNLGGTENGSTYAGDNGGGVRLSGTTAVLANCTIYLNRGMTNPGVRIEYNKGIKGRVVNCVIVDNLTMNGAWDFSNIGGPATSADGFENCMTDARIAQPNASCFGGPYGFVDHTGNDYHLTAASSAVDAGAAVTLYSNLDLDGNPRLSGSALDVGCYEYQQDEPSIGIAVDREEAFTNVLFTFTAAVKGGSLEGGITWNFGDGQTETTSALTCTHAYADLGAKDVSVSATVGGRPVSYTAHALVKACAETILADGNPYTFEDAYGYATDGTTILVTNGTTTAKSQIFLRKGITVKGISDSPTNVIFKVSGSSRVFWMSHPDAAIRNVTITGGKIIQSLGGNVYISDFGGMLSNCVVSAGIADNYNANGGNLNMSSGLVTHCVITGGTVNNTGGGSKAANVVISGGVLEHSLIVKGNDTTKGDNAATTAGVRITGGVMRNCTVAGNAGKTTGGVSAGGGSVVNCVIAGNASSVTGGDTAAFSGTASVFEKCALDTAAPVNESCLSAAAAALLADVSNEDYHAAPGSPVVDAGLELMNPPEVDLDGNARIQGEGIDMGCYEYAGQFAVTFDADPREAIFPAQITFTAIVDGADEGDIIDYQWDFDGDGEIDDVLSGPVAVYNATAGGVFTSALYVTDVTKGISAEAVRVDFLKLAPPVLYVDVASENPVSPFVGWDTAATNVQEAVDAAVDGCEVVVTSGVYRVKSRLLVEKGVRVRGFSGNPDDVTLHSSGCGSLFISSTNAVVESMAFTNGYSNGGTQAGFEFGVSGGMVSNCVVRNSSALNWSGSGPAFYSPYTNALITHCTFAGCTLSGYSGGDKPIAYLAKGRLVNSLFVGCSDAFNADDDHISLLYVGKQASVANCTFVGNTSGDCFFIKVEDGGAVTNCVFAGNTFKPAEDGVAYSGFAVADGQAFSHCAFDAGFDEAPGDASLLGTAADFFENFAEGNLTPARLLVGAGVNYEGISRLDLAGRARLIGRTIDIGCYEGDMPFTLFLLK